MGIFPYIKKISICHICKKYVRRHVYIRRYYICQKGRKNIRRRRLNFYVPEMMLCVKRDKEGYNESSLAHSRNK